VSLWRSRPAVAVWLIAALLHAPAIGSVAAAEAALPEVVATLVPIAAGVAAAVALLVLTAGLRRRRSAPSVARAAISLEVPPRAALVSLLFLASPRPPPHSL
jgi:hypothetical protein